MCNLTVSSQSLPIACGLGILIGVSTHVGLFIHGEWHVQAQRIARLHLAILLIVFGGMQFCKAETTLAKLFMGLAAATVSYIIALLGSILLYRIIPGLHRLSGFQGQSCSAHPNAGTFGRAEAP